MEKVNEIVLAINSVAWGPAMLILLFGTHLFITFRTRFIQLYTFKAIKLSLTKDPEATGDISPFAALATALAATIGTGNIVGVATAIASGGPGAVFWCWLTGVFGMATKYGEATLAVKFRVKTADGTMLGGPMYSLENGLKNKAGKILGILFAFFTGFACFGIGNMTQANSVSTMVQSNFHVSPTITGIILTIGTACVILGGVKSISKVCEKLVPVMAALYILGCIIILFLHYDYIIPAITTIVSSAFTPRAAGGGFIGATVMMSIRYGMSRGLFTNESGLGSSPIADAAAQARNPVRQGLVAMTGVFWDTIIICAITGIVLVSSILRNPEKFDGLTGGAVTTAAFDSIPVIGPIVLTIGLITFAWSTILGWSYYGERCWEYLFGKKAILPFRVVYSAMVFVGAVVALDVVWNIADMLNAFMAFPNLVSLLALSGVLVAETKKYLWDDNLDGYSDDEMRVVEDK